MKSKSKILRGITVLCLLSSVLCFTGCVSGQAKKFAEFEKLGVTEIQISGKFSNTEYRVVEADGKRVATLDHSNAWLTKVHIVRTTPAALPQNGDGLRASSADKSRPASTTEQDK